MNIKKLEKEFDKKFQPKNKETGNLFKEFKSFYREKFIEVLFDINEDIEKIKKVVQRDSGTFKFDSCYEDVQRLIKSRIEEYEK